MLHSPFPATILVVTAELVMLCQCWSCAGENAGIGKVTVIRVTIAVRFMIIHAVEVTSVFWVN